MVETKERELISGSTIYLAPAGYHLLVDDNYTFSLSKDAPVNYLRPSIDVTFESAAEVFSDALIGILLTCANEDGAYGIQVVKQKGGYTIIQYPTTAQVSVMPKAVIDLMTLDIIFRWRILRIE